MQHSRHRQLCCISNRLKKASAVVEIELPSVGTAALIHTVTAGGALLASGRGGAQWTAGLRRTAPGQLPCCIQSSGIWTRRTQAPSSSEWSRWLLFSAYASTAPRLRADATCRAVASWFVVDYSSSALHGIDIVLRATSHAQGTVWLSPGEA